MCDKPIADTVVKNESFSYERLYGCPLYFTISTQHSTRNTSHGT